MDKILRDLYDSEINCIISSFWDAGFCVSIGDNINGIKAESDCLNVAEIPDELIRLGIKCWPDSEFAKKYKE